MYKKRRKTNTDFDHSKTHIDQQTKHELRHDLNRKIVFELQEIGWNLSKVRINYKLTKRTKSEKHKK